MKRQKGGKGGTILMFWLSLAIGNAPRCYLRIGVQQSYCKSLVLKVGPLALSINISWELVIMQVLRSHPWPAESEPLWGRQCVLTSLLVLMHMQVWAPLCKPNSGDSFFRKSVLALCFDLACYSYGKSSYIELICIKEISGLMHPWGMTEEVNRNSGRGQTGPRGTRG